MKKRLHWAWYFGAWVLGIALGGAVIGVITFSLAGLVFDTGRSTAQLALNGLRILGFYGFIWAPGIALVVTVKREYEARSKLRSENPSAR